MKKRLNIAIVGATGLVGSTLLSILDERKFPINNLYLLASKHSFGDAREFQGKTLKIEDTAQFDFSQTELSFFCVGNEISAEFAPLAVKHGNIVIDKSSYFRNDTDLPLIIPEVNGDTLATLKKLTIISSPNCNTIPILMALKPIYDAVGILSLHIATYQSVSGTGRDGVKELAEQTAQLLNGKPIKIKIYPEQIAFNILPHIDAFQDNGYTLEEMKLIWETHKILEDKNIKINPTTVRVPVFYGHSAAVYVETEKNITAKKALGLLKKAPGIKLSSGEFGYSTPVKDASGNDFIYVGRVRETLFGKNGLNLWIVGDNVRKGAALNAVHIAELLIKQGKFDT